MAAPPQDDTGILGFLGGWFAAPTCGAEERRCGGRERHDVIDRLSKDELNSFKDQLVIVLQEIHRKDERIAAGDFDAVEIAHFIDLHHRAMMIAQRLGRDDVVEEMRRGIVRAATGAGGDGVARELDLVLRTDPIAIAIVKTVEARLGICVDDFRVIPSPEPVPAPSGPVASAPVAVSAPSSGAGSHLPQLPLSDGPTASTASATGSSQQAPADPLRLDSSGGPASAAPHSHSPRHFQQRPGSPAVSAAEASVPDDGDDFGGVGADPSDIGTAILQPPNGDDEQDSGFVL